MLKRNIISNFFTRGLLLLIALAVTPIIVKVFGDEKYGIFILVITVLGYGSLFELGLGSSLVKLFADSNIKNKQEVYQTAFWLYLTLSLLAFIVIFFSKDFISTELFNVSKENYLETVDALIMIAIALPFKLFTIFFGAILSGYERLHEVNIGNIYATVFRLLLSTYLIYLGYSISVAIAVYIVSFIITLFIYVKYINKLIYIELANILFFSKSLAKNIIKLSLHLFSANASGELAQHMDKFIIANVLGAAFVTPYTIAYTIAARIWDVVNAISSATYPRFNAVIDDITEIKRIYKKTLLLGYGTGGVLTIFFFIFAELIISFWIDQEMAIKSAYILQIFSVAMFIGIPNWFNGILLVSIGKAKIVSMAMFITALINVVLCYILALYFELLGVVIGWSVGYIISMLIMSYYVFKYFKGNK
ncbi:flippase [Arcobacter sp. FWKO B]|uniref:flippase n=1 Tax=Arcobacter sp. FWKO B TaxID=2593672 RepID=UPI0018A62D38|nr:flippase [Arcobacter sp. FWKO B]QOG12081.1 flippase [Arcobacter sp. FWKO B]